MRILQTFLAAAFVVGVGSTVNAAPILNVGTDAETGQQKLVSALNVSVDGTLYDVQFLDGSCGDVFGSCAFGVTYTFGTEAAAQAASNALFDQVLIDASPGAPSFEFDSRPDQVAGCQWDVQCQILTPYSFSNPSQVLYVRLTNHTTESSDILETFASFITIDTSPPPPNVNPPDSRVWAFWSLAGSVPIPGSSPVPESGTLGVLGIGLACVGLVSRRRAFPRRA